MWNTGIVGDVIQSWRDGRWSALSDFGRQDAFVDSHDSRLKFLDKRRGRSPWLRGEGIHYPSTNNRPIARGSKHNAANPSVIWLVRRKSSQVDGRTQSNSSRVLTIDAHEHRAIWPKFNLKAFVEWTWTLTKDDFSPGNDVHQLRLSYMFIVIYKNHYLYR